MPRAFISGFTYVVAATTPTAAVAEPAKRRRLILCVALVAVTASRSSPVAADRDALSYNVARARPTKLHSASLSVSCGEATKHVSHLVPICLMLH